MLSTYNLNKPIKDHYFILLALCISLLLPTVTHARECGDIESKEFWQNATAEEVNECVIDRLAPLETTIATFGGLGMSYAPEGDVFAIYSVFRDTPAFHAGLKAGDLIIKIDDRDVRTVFDDEVASLLKGAPGTIVKLTISRANQTPFDIAILRKVVTFTSSKLDEMGILNSAVYHSANPLVIQLLIDAGSDVNHRDGNGATPLFSAAGWSNNPAIITTLINAGADVGIRNHYDDTPFHHAGMFAENPLVIKALVDAGADINAIDRIGYTPLHEAASGKSLTIVKALIKAGASVNARAENGRTPLHSAFLSGPLIIQTLIDAGANVNSKDGRGETILNFAVSRGLTQIIELLIKADANVNTKNIHGQSILSQAANEWFTDNESVVKLLIDAGADVNAVDSNGKSILHQVVRKGDIEVIKLLIKGGADVNAVDKNENSVLSIEVNRSYFSNLNVIKLLIDLGADINTIDNSGNSLLNNVKKPILHDKELVRLLVEAGAEDIGSPADFEAAFSTTPTSATLELVTRSQLVINGIESATAPSQTRQAEETTKPVQKLDEFGCGDIMSVLFWEEATVQLVQDCVIKRGLTNRKFIQYSRVQTMLHPAILYNGNPLIVKALIEAGVNINYQNEGMTSLGTALQHERSLEIPKMLIDAGANINVARYHGETPLYDALSFHIEDKPTMVKLLIEAGTDVNATSYRGASLLHRNIDVEIATILLEAGVDVNAKDDDGNSPLYFVWNKEVAQLFIDAGAEIHAKNNNGATALHLVKNAETATVLLETGADVNAKDNDGSSPLHLARDESITAFLIEAGAEVNAQNHNGNTPLHLKSKGWDFKLMTLLINSNADVNLKNKNGKTPIQLAFEQEIFTFSGCSLTDWDAVAQNQANERNRKRASIQLLADSGALLDEKTKSYLSLSSKDGGASLLIQNSININNPFVTQ